MRLLAALLPLISLTPLSYSREAHVGGTEGHSIGQPRNFPAGESPESLNELSKDRSKKSVFDQAHRDCAWARGGLAEADCVETRMLVIRRLSSMKESPTLRQARQDCSWAIGGLAEADCIEMRQNAIERVSRMRASPILDQAKNDCAWARGGLAEADCIDMRMRAIERVNSLRKEAEARR
jgi:hypothetical protein